MKIQYYWLLKDYIVCRVVPPITTIEDLKVADMPLQQYFDASTQEKVHLIIDARAIIEMPSSFPLSKQGWLRHPKLGWIIAVGNQKPQNEAKGAVAAKAVSRNIRHYTTFEAAFHYLQANDCNLPDLSAIQPRNDFATT